MIGTWIVYDIPSSVNAIFLSGANMDSDAKNVYRNMLILNFSEPLWPIEARNAAIANIYYSVAINRVGTVSHAFINS